MLLLNCFTCYDTRPALLTIKQLTTKQGDEVTYQAVFKQPQVQGRFLNLSVITNCDSTLVNAKTNSSALEETFPLTCAEPLASNVGIEIGQLSIIAVALTLTFAVTRTGLKLTRPMVSLPVYIVGGVSVYWFIDRSLQVVVG